MAGTIQQIAEIAGVSRGTVDRALNNRGRVNSEVAERVKKIAEELDYIPKRRKHKTTALSKKIKIGVITQLSDASFMLEVKRGISDAKNLLLNRGVELLVKEGLSIDEEEQTTSICELMEQGIAGLAIMPVESEAVRMCLNRITEERNIPVVTFNSDIVGTKRISFVGLDNRKSGQTAAGLMGMMTRGRGKVLIITGFFSNTVNSLRVDGFIEEIKTTFPEIELIGVQSSFDNADEVEKIICSSMEMFPHMAGIFVVSGGQNGLKRAFDHMGVLNRPYTIIYDLSPENERLLRNGDVDFLIDQEGYIQGFRPPFLLADRIQADKGSEKELLYTNINIKTKYNI